MPHFGDYDYSGRESPGDGVTPMFMSKEPLATEGEATPGPDDYNPFDEIESVQQQTEFQARQRAVRDRQPKMPEFGSVDLSLPDIF